MNTLYKNLAEQLNENPDVQTTTWEQVDGCARLVVAEYSLYRKLYLTYTKAGKLNLVAQGLNPRQSINEVVLRDATAYNSETLNTVIVAFKNNTDLEE